MEVTTEFGKRIIQKEDIDCYRATVYNLYNCVIYLKNGESVWIFETFEQVDEVFDL